MGNIYIDGEKVDFDGPAPASCGEACQLIDGFLAGQGKVIAEVVLNGESVSIEKASEQGEFESLEFATTTPEQQLLEMCRVWSEACAKSVEGLSQLGRSCLRQRWPESQSETLRFLEEFRSVIEGLGILQNYGAESRAEWSSDFGGSFERGVGAVDQVVDAIEAKSPTRLSDTLVGAMQESWSEVKAKLDRQVVPALEGRRAR